MVLYEFRGRQICASSEEFCFKKARGTKRSRPGGEFLACTLSRDPTRCCSRAGIGRYLVGGPGDVEASVCLGRPSCLRKSDSGKKKGSSFTANFTCAK
jgi:hypothetical protein